MQQIINGKERTQAYLKFLLFFVITVMVVVTAVFFDFYMPRKENKLLKDEVYVQRRQEANQQKFVDKMNVTVNLIDSLNNSKTNSGQLLLQIHAQMDDLQHLQENTGGLYRELDKVIIIKLQDLLDGRDKITQLEGDIKKYKDDLDNCKGQVQAAPPVILNR